MFGVKSGVDANTTIDTGGYYLATNISNANTYSYLMSVKFTNNTAVQFNISNTATWLKMRCLKDDGTWSDWKEIAFKQEAEKPPVILQKIE